VSISVTLHEHKRTYKGKSYTYWLLRWMGTDGVRHGQSLGRKDQMSKRQAEKLRQTKQNELDANPGRRDVSRGPELGTFLENYYAARKAELAAGTLELHQQTGRYLVEFFGEQRRLDSIGRAEARAFKTALAEGKLAHVNKRLRRTPMLEASTVDRHVREARTIFGHALTDDLITLNPFDKLGSSKLVKKEWHYVSSEEFGRLMLACKPAWKLMLGLARWAGLRAEEALELPWRHVDLVERRLAIVARRDWKPKDGDARTVPIRPELYDLLQKARLGDCVAEMLIPPGDVGRTNIWRDFETVFKRAGVPRYSKPMHSLRKSCITDWAAVHPSHVVQEWAGHSDYRTTAQHYLKGSDADYRKAAGLTESSGGEAREEKQSGEPGQSPSGSPRSGLEGRRDKADGPLAENVGDPSRRSADATEGADHSTAGGEMTQKLPQNPESDPSNRRNSIAGEGIRTPDVQLGKLAFYH
jgi:integrase